VPISLGAGADAGGPPATGEIEGVIEEGAGRRIGSPGGAEARAVAGAPCAEALFASAVAPSVAAPQLRNLRLSMATSYHPNASMRACVHALMISI